MLPERGDRVDVLGLDSTLQTLRWKDADADLVRSAIEQQEAVLERMRAQLRAYEQRRHANIQ
jgi:hypothetical protein